MSLVKAIGLCAMKSRSAVLSATYSTGLPGLLSDVNVLDMTRIVAGPFCTMTLGDLGANVIKVENLDGDESRKWGPPFVPGTKDAYYFLSVNRNKKSICIDLKTQAGREVFYDLAKKSDVMVENFVPGKLDEMQLGYEKLSQLNEQLIYCAITGFGPTGPYSKDPGYDVIAAAVGGLLNCTGQRDGEPVKPAVPLTDMCTGLHAFGAIMTALYHRMKTGKGQRIDCNLLSTQVNVMLNIAFTYLNCNIEGQKWGTAHASIVPYQAFPTSDGHYVIGAGSDSQFVQLCKRIGREDLVADERFKTNPDRVKHRSEIIKIVSDVIKTRTKNEWKTVFKGASFPNGPVNTMKEVFEDEHINEIGLVQNVEHPDAGTLRMVGPPTVYSEGGNLIRSPPPQLGQHTEEVLGTFLGYKTEKINDLFSNKIEPAEPVTVITLRPPRKQERKKVVWAEDTVDNENMNKKKSKCCCIYEKPHKFGESDSEDSSDECEHCSGHVERRGKHGHHHQQTTSSADVTDGTTVQPTETVTVAAEPPAILTLRPKETTALTSQPTELRPAPPDKGADLPAKSS